MKNALIQNSDIIKDSVKLISKANKEITRMKDPKLVGFVTLFNTEVEQLVKKKDCSAKLRKELEGRDKIMRIREQIIEKKKSLEGKLLIKHKENQTKKEALEQDIEQVALLLLKVKENLESEPDQQ